MSNLRDQDFAALARSEAGSGVPLPRRRWLPRALPWLLALILLGIIGWASRGLLERAVTVTVIRPTLLSTENRGFSAVSEPALFQAAGWVEPDPFPMALTALAEGTVATVLVQESEELQAGQAVATLVDEDARLARDRAQSAVERAEANLVDAEAELANAREAFEAALEVTEALAVSEAELHGKQAESIHRAASVRKGEAAVKLAEAELGTQRYLRDEGAVGPWQVEQAEARLEEAQGELALLKADAALAVAEQEKAKAQLERARRDLELRLAERLRIVRGESAVMARRADLGEARAALAEAELRRARMTVVTPAAGIVLKRLAEPGSRAGPMADPICEIYDPQRLRVRVDVPQTQVGAASVGQRAEIRCDVRRDRPYQGEVLRIVHAADIQKVTLEVQVRIVDPDPLIRPDMLCQVTVFGARIEGEPRGDGTGRPAMQVPARCVDGDAVWVVGADGVSAERRAVQVLGRDGDTAIVHGLNASDKVIDGSSGELKAGVRISVQEETR